MAAQDRKKEEKARELYNTDKPKTYDLERKNNTGWHLNIEELADLEELTELI